MWIQRAIEKYGFEGGVDFTINKIVNGKNAQLVRSPKRRPSIMAMRKVEELATEDGFGLLSKIDISI